MCNLRDFTLQRVKSEETILCFAVVVKHCSFVFAVTQRTCKICNLSHGPFNNKYQDHVLCKYW